MQIHAYDREESQVRQGSEWLRPGCLLRPEQLLRNIWGDKFYYINFVSWNSESAVPFTILSGVNLAGYLTTSTANIQVPSKRWPEIGR